MADVTPIRPGMEAALSRLKAPAPSLDKHFESLIDEQRCRCWDVQAIIACVWLALRERKGDDWQAGRALDTAARMIDKITAELDRAHLEEWAEKLQHGEAPHG